MERQRGDRWLAADGNLTPAQTLASGFKVAALNYTDVNYRRTFGRAGGFGGIGISSVGQSYCRSHVVPSSICRTLPPRLQSSQPDHHPKPIAGFTFRRRSCRLALG